MEPIISVNHVTKRFKAFYDRGYNLKERMLFKNRNNYEWHTVLNDVSFSVNKGEALALIGQNGCGKSTMLKLLTKIIYPNSGSISINGRVACLIELGAGFHPDMTGRENIYINASIFGLSHKEIEARIDDIISFSELDAYIDAPVRTYSSGMYMRLAFSIAISVDADILLVDEILAVGDADFQAKCIRKLHLLKEQGVSIVIVSHDMNMVQSFCDRALWISNGTIATQGPPCEVVHSYLFRQPAEMYEHPQQADKDSQNATERTERNHWIRSFHGLRFLFVTLLFLHHLDNFNDLHIPYWNDFYSWFHECFFSVNFFIILSGFVVSYGYSEKLQKGLISRRRFLVNRFLHIWPLHILTLFFALIIVHGGEFLTHLTSPLFWLNGFLLHAWIPDMNSSFALSYNSVSWTASVEWFCYFAFTVLAFMDKRTRHILTGGLWGYILCCILLAEYNLLSLPGWVSYVNPLFRLADFLLGMTLFDLFKQGVFVPATKKAATFWELFASGIFIMFIIFAVKSHSIAWHWHSQVYYTIPSILMVYLFSFDKGFLSGILSKKTIQKLGNLSLHIYFLHQPIIVICKTLLLPYLTSIPAIFITGALAFLLTLITAVVIDKLYVIPVRKLLQRLACKCGFLE